MRRPSHRVRRRAGFAYIAAIVLLVVMATLAMAMVRINTAQLTASTQDILGIRATQAVRAGVQWGLYQTRDDICLASRDLTDFKASTGFVVTVACTSASFNEGESAPGTVVVKRIYRIVATACNIGATCPNNASATSVDYVERSRVATACLTSTKGECY